MIEYPIPGLDEYFVTEDGTVISRKHGRRKELKVLIKLRKTARARSGCRPTYQICFTRKLKDGGYEKVTKQLHQVVCAAKCGRWPESCEEVRHLDGDYSNNTMSNLCYGDHLNNIIDDIENGKRQTNEAYLDEAIARLCSLRG